MGLYSSGVAVENIPTGKNLAGKTAFHLLRNIVRSDNSCSRYTGRIRRATPGPTRSTGTGRQSAAHTRRKVLPCHRQIRTEYPTDRAGDRVPPRPCRSSRCGRRPIEIHRSVFDRWGRGTPPAVSGVIHTVRYQPWTSAADICLLLSRM